MSNITTYTPIPDGTGATPSVFNSRMSQLQLNIRSLNTSKIEASAGIITEAYIGNAAVSSSKLATNAVTTSKIVDDAVTGDKILDTSVITCTKLNASTGQAALKVYNQPSTSRYFSITNGANSVEINGYDGTSTYGGWPFINWSRKRMILNGFGGGDDAPSAGDASGSVGEIAFDGSYVYLCTSANSWRRAALSAF